MTRTAIISVMIQVGALNAHSAIDECLPQALQQLHAKAQAISASLLENTVKVESIESGWINSYVKFSGMVVDPSYSQA